jgi:LysR family transcriptional regulator for bpeEF and oprC
MLHSEQQSTGRFRAAHFSHLRHLTLFALVVDSGSFTIAAQRLGIGKSSVSRQISELETYVGARLLNRSTRALSLTDSGRLIYQDCAQLVSAATDAFDKLDGDLPLEGTLRIASTVEHGQYVLPPIVATFLSRFPNIDVDLVLGDSFVDLVDRGIDLAVRVGSPGPSPHYISRKIAEMEYRLYGHRTLVDGAPYLRSPEDAAKLPWLLNSGSPERGRWTFEKDGAEIAISVSGRVISTGTACPQPCSISARICCRSTSMGTETPPSSYSQKVHPLQLGAPCTAAPT